jgi:FXSXX-COOH protein
MDVRGESVREPVGRPPAGDTCPAGPEAPLPDLLELDLAELRTIQHPVLNELVEDLRERVTRPSETLWAFTSSF